MTSAMPKLDPPLHLENPENETRLEFLQEVVARPGFDDYSPVSCSLVESDVKIISSPVLIPIKHIYCSKSHGYYLFCLL